MTSPRDRLPSPKWRPLGVTGLRVTRVGLGLAALGRPAYMTVQRDADLGDDRSVEAMEQRCHRMLDAARESGVGYIDTARSYGRAEEFLASWLSRRRMAPGKITIGSKWGYAYRGDWRMDAPVHEIKDLSRETLVRQAGETRRWLGAHLGLLQIHSATIDSGVLGDHAVLDELVRLRSEGVVIGLTVTGPGQSESIRAALQVRVDGINPFQVVQATWNVLEPSAGAALAEAKSHGWGVIVKEALANGRLTDRYVTAGALAHLRARELAMPLQAFAFAAAASQPFVDVVLSGAVTPGQLQENVEAADTVVPDDALSGLAVTPSEYWTERAALPWT